MTPTKHLWICGGHRAERMAIVEATGVPTRTAPVDAHRRLRGPYTAAGTVLRALVPPMSAGAPDLIERYLIEILSAAPELAAVLPRSEETLTTMALPKERTRFYARLRTGRIANGLTELLRDGLSPGPSSLIFENVDQADPTDLELLGALVRRVDPARLLVVVCTNGPVTSNPALDALLSDRADAVHLPATDHRSSEPEPSCRQEPGWLYVASECLSEDRGLRIAYEGASAWERAGWHDRRAAELEARGEQSLRLGAIPFHRERGRDPRGAGCEALLAAQDHCVCLGYYEAVVDYGHRMLDIVDSATQHEMWWACTVQLGLALSVLSRTREAEALFDDARFRSISPAVHMAAAYSTAMLYTRHNEVRDRDERKAKAWLHGAIALASLNPDPAERAFQTAFNKNGLALVEVNLGTPAEALRLVNECIAMLDRELTPDQHRLHRTVLKNNRARVYMALGRLDDALADYAVVIGADPNHAEHYLERGNLYRRAGRYDEAFADYERALRLTPPFAEIYYNRGDLYLTIGDEEAALADFSYVLELDPTFVDAYINRAGILLAADDLDGAASDAEAGMAFEPDNPHLHLVLGQVHEARGALDEAMACYDRAVASDPSLAEALGARASLLHELGRTTACITDLDAAILLDPDDAQLRFNRSVAYRSCQRWSDALADLTVASDLAPDDPDIAVALEACRLHAVGRD